jgi:TPR repeat protein
MAIEKGNSDAMFYFGVYYNKIEINYDLMKKYYLMAAEKGHTHGITHLKTYNRNKT